METLANDPVRRARLGQQAHEDALRRYAWTAKGKKTAEVYEWVLGRAGGEAGFLFLIRVVCGKVWHKASPANLAAVIST